MGNVLNQLSQAMDNPNFKLCAREEPDGSTVFYANAGVEYEHGIIIRSFTAEAKASIFHTAQKKGRPIEQATADFISASAGAEFGSLYTGVDANLSLIKLKASVFDLNIGVGVETGAGIKDGSLDLHLAGCGFQIGRKVSISVFGGSFGIDFGPLFG